MPPQFGYDHIHIVSKDVKETTSYFERVFGAELTSFNENLKGAPNAALFIGGMKLFVRGIRPGENPDAVAPDLVEGLDHFGLQVDDIEAAAVWLKARGAEFILGPERTGVGGRMIAFIRGPGNIRIELCEHRAG